MPQLARALSFPASRATFSDRIKGQIELMIGAEKFSFPAGSLERIRIKATVYGFQADVVIGVVCDGVPDPLFASFTKPDLMTATLELANGNQGYADEKAAPWTIKGVVSSRKIVETTSEEQSGTPVVLRKYSIQFLDPACFFWSRHRPVELFTGASMKEIITGYLPPGMQIDGSWNALDESLEMICVGTGSEGPAHFYDLLVWFVHENHGVIEFDAAKAKYRFAAAKSKNKQSLAIDPDITRQVLVRPSEPRRRSANVLNAYSDAATRSKKIANADAVTGVRRDALLRSPLQPPMDRLARVETDRLDAAGPTVEVRFQRLPPAFSFPNATISLAEEFSSALHSFGKKYRVYEAEIDAEIEARVDVGDPDDNTAVFQLSYTLWGEQQSDGRPRLPDFKLVRYPIIVEGKVLAAAGGDDDRTWTAQENEVNALHAYRVNIPLWNKVVKTPFLPDRQPGHFFFPLYKNERVLVALFFDHAEVVGTLDWAGRLAQTTQGNQIMWGKREKDETIARHVYQEAKPILTVTRKLAGDTQTITVSEGVIRFVVEELQETAATPPKYNLTPKVDAAVDAVAAEVRANIAKMSGSFETSMASSTANLEAAQAEVEGALESSAAEIGAKIAATEAKLGTMMSSATEAVVEATAAVEDAKAALVKALYE